MHSTAQASKNPLKKGLLGICAILNITPNSFSDGGLHNTLPSAITTVEDMLAHNVDVIDIGAESSAPGAARITQEEEQSRLAGILPHLTENFPEAVFSIDTINTKTAEYALNHGVKIVNDLTAAKNNPSMLSLVAERGAYYILSHILSFPSSKTEFMKEQGPQLMDKLCAETTTLMEAAVRAGINEEKLMVDPGIGFGKDAAQSLYIIENAAEYKHKTGAHATVMGHSRKRIVKAIAEPLANRPLQYPQDNQQLDEITNTISAYLINRADFVRIHNYGIFQGTVGAVCKTFSAYHDTLA